MTAITVDLYSDTQTRPTPAMREAMAAAPVGDEQRGEDPSVNRLCEMAAALLGKEAAMFLPSGTMCNEIAILLHCRPGDEILCDATSHIIIAEAGGPAVFAGAMITPLNGDRGIYTVADLEAGLRASSRHAPRSRLVEIEQTSNFGGGSIWPMAAIEAVADAARTHGLAVHMDGARLLNAVVAAGVSAARFAGPADTVWLDLSKGLGCPVGAVLAGSRDAIDEAWSWKHRMGGAMRQAGIIAAAGVYALEHNVERLAEDHANAKRLAEALAEIPGIQLDPALVETNIAFFDLPGRSAAAVRDALLQKGVRVGAVGPNRVRVLTHLDVDAAGIDRAISSISDVLAELPES